MFGDCVFPYLFIDASTEEYEEGEGDYEEEEEEHFDQCTNQGKLYECKLARIPLQIYLFREPYQSQVFILQAFIYQSIFIVYLCLSPEIITRASSSI